MSTPSSHKDQGKKMSKLFISIDPLSQEFKTHIRLSKLELSVCYFLFPEMLKILYIYNI